MAKKTQIEQAIADRKKVIRTAVRLKHALAADHELNDVVDDNIKALTKALQKGKLPAPPDLGKLLKLDVIADPDGD